MLGSQYRSGQGEPVQGCTVAGLVGTSHWLTLSKEAVPLAGVRDDTQWTSRVENPDVDTPQDALQVPQGATYNASPKIKNKSEQ